VTVVRELEALHVRPGEVLVIRLAEPNAWDDLAIEDLLENLALIGLANRSIVIHGNVEFAVTEKHG
jgi:hypothetical protein